jgi:hypothetical protein
MDPEQMDYFWPTLQAAVHFVAVNFSNLVSVVEYVISDADQHEMQKIVANENEWRRQYGTHLTLSQLVGQLQHDILNLLNGYAQELYKADRHWRRHIPNWTFAFPYK